MFKHILIPLDGSPLAERALQPGFAIARAFGAEVTLLRVVNADQALAALPALAPAVYAEAGVSVPVNANGAGDYLRQTSQRWAGEGVEVTTRVLAGAPAAAIVSAAQEAACDLIVMSTHGRSAVGRIIYGSVAEAVVRGARLPVMLVPVQLPF